MAKRLDFKNQDGMTLMEVLIASTIFFLFIVSFLTGQSFNLLESSSMHEESILRHLAQSKLNEIVVNPPDFSETLTETGSKIDAKEFEEFPGYKYSTSIKKIFIPDFTKLQGNQEEDSGQDQQLMKEIFSQFKKNMEKMVWQVQVTIENVDTGQQYIVSTWLYDPKAQVEITGF